MMEGTGGRRRVTVCVMVMRSQVEGEDGRIGVGRGSEIVIVTIDGVGTGGIWSQCVGLFG